MTDDKPPYYMGEYNNKFAAFHKDHPTRPLAHSHDDKMIRGIVSYMNKCSKRLDNQKGPR